MSEIQSHIASTPAFGGEMRGRIRAFDWCATALGPMGEWTTQLCATVDLMVAHGFPMAVLWGPDLILLYNDGYRAILGGRHPGALGRSVRDRGSEVWSGLQPVVERVWAGETVVFQSEPVAGAERDPIGTTHYGHSYSPIPENGQTAGVLLTLHRCEGQLPTTASAYQFQTLATAGANVVYRTSPDWRVLFHLQGRMFRNVPLPLENWIEHYILDGDVGRFQAEVDQAVSNKTPFELEHRVRLPAGGFGWIHSRAIPIFDADGEIAEWLGGGMDISERKRRESDAALLDEIGKDFAQLSDPLQIMQAVGVRIGKYLNLSTCHFCEVDESLGTVTVHYGWTADGVPTLEQTYHWEDFLTEEFGAAGRGGETFVVSDVSRDPRTDPRVYAAVGIGAFVAVPFLSGGRWVAYLAANDKAPREWHENDLLLLKEVGERLFGRVKKARAEMALRESEERQAFLLELSDALRNVTSVADIQHKAMTALGSQLEVTRAFCYEVDADGHSISLSAKWDRSDGSLAQRMSLAEFGADVEQEYRGGRSVFVCDTERETPSELGRAAFRAIRVRAWIGVPLVKEGRLVTAVGVHSTDVRRWTSAEVRLVEDVAERTWVAAERARAETSMRETEAQLRAADRQKDEFLAMLAHELRNPIAPIRAVTDLLSRPLQDAAVQAEAIGILNRQTVHLARLVDDLMDVSRITQGRIELRRSTLNLMKVVSHAIEGVDTQLQQKGHDLTVIDHHKPLYVDGDFARLVQCVSNVLINAVKYTNPGGRLSLELREEGSWAVIEISDNGMGMSAELLPKIFDLFVQSERTLDRAQGGLGIGLSVVKRLVQMHNGEIRVTSGGPGSGSTFELRLPQVPAPKAAADDKTAISSPPRRLLVVDDNQDAAQSLGLILQFAGHQVKTLYSAVEALEYIEEFEPEAVLLDLGLPGMNGYELAAHCRSQPRLCTVRFIAVTGYGQPEDLARTREAGFDGHFVKPVDIQKLESALSELPESIKRPPAST